MIEAVVEKLELNLAGLKVYQDGLPICGKELDIVTEVAASGSQNYQLLQKLQRQGAVLMGTESASLLQQEYALMMKAIQTHAYDKTALEKEARALLNQRDEFIAQRINDTLHADEMGILFLGLMHAIEEKLDDDITLIQPLGKSPLQKHL